MCEEGNKSKDEKFEVSMMVKGCHRAVIRLLHTSLPLPPLPLPGNEQIEHNFRYCLRRGTR